MATSISKGKKRDPLLGAPIPVMRRTIMFNASSPGEALYRLGEWWDKAPKEEGEPVTDSFEFIAEGHRFLVRVEPLDPENYQDHLDGLHSVRVDS